jgi:Fe2+ or Zn2+ uptake regulation protein
VERARSSAQPPAHRVDDVVAGIRAAGGRATPARRAIVEVLVGGPHHQHLTAEEVTERVQAVLPDVALSTVYRSMEALEELGFVEHLHIGHGPAVYHLAAEQHLHLVCESCGAVTELPQSTLDAIGEEIRHRHRFRIEPRHFALSGLCEECGE